MRNPPNNALQRTRSAPLRSPPNFKTSRVVVSEIVWVHRYYGDDCLAFEAPGHSGGGGGYFIACGDRQPYRLSKTSSEEWSLGDSELTAKRYFGADEVSNVVPQRRGGG